MKLLTTREVSALIGVPAGTLQNLRWRGEGPKYVKVSRRSVRYRDTDLEQWISEHVQDPARRHAEVH